MKKIRILLMDNLKKNKQQSQANNQYLFIRCLYTIKTM